jgi:hypothetical protein
MNLATYYYFSACRSNKLSVSGVLQIFTKFDGAIARISVARAAPRRAIASAAKFKIAEHP